MANPSGTNYTNLQKIIEANRNNQLGSTIQGGVNKGISGLQSGVNQSQNQFQNDVNNANLNTDANQQYTQNTIGGIVNPQAQQPSQQVTSSSTAPPSQQQSQQVQPSSTAPKSPLSSMSQVLAPTPQPSTTAATTTAAPAPETSAPGSFGAPVSNPTSGSQATPNTYNQQAADVQKFGKLLQGGYLGPNQLSNYNTLLAQGQNLQGLGSNLNTTGGLQNLLQQYIGGNNYTQGQQGLDTLLLGQTAKPQLQDISKNLRNVLSIPQSAESRAEGLARQTATGNQQFASGLKNQLQSAQNPIMQAIQGNIQNLNEQNQMKQTQAQNINDVLSRAPMGATAGQINRRGGGAAGPTTEYGQAQQAVEDAYKNHIIDDAGFDQLNQLMATMQVTGSNPKDVLQQAFEYNPNLPQYTLQQGANAQQAAQLNALAQLSGQQQQFGTYGGADPYSAMFNANKLPDLAQYQGKLLQNPTLHRDAPSQGFEVNPAIYEDEYNQKLSAYNQQQKQLQDLIAQTKYGANH